MRKEVFRGVKKNKLDAEKRIASFVIFYDIEQIQIFLNDFVNSVMSSEFILSEPMRNFIQIIEDIAEEKTNLLNTGDKSWNHYQLVDEIVYRSEMKESSEKKRSEFLKWIEEVKEVIVDKNKQDLFLLGEDCSHYFYWQAFLDKIQEINNSSKSFREKLEIKLPSIESSSSKNIIKLDEIQTTTFGDSKYTMGVDELDLIINIQPTNFILVAARPSVGKSMFVMNMSIKNSFKNIDSLYVSLEMTPAQTRSRILSWVKNDEVEEDDIDELCATEAYRKINEHFYMSEAESINGDIIVSNMASFLEEHPGGMIILDSINLVKYTGDDEWASLRKISRECKKLAIKYKAVIVSCCLATRDSEFSGLSLSSLYGGSMLEADSDVVIGLDPKSKSTTENSLSSVTGKILKNRDGIKDLDVDLKLQKSTMRWYDSSEY